MTETIAIIPARGGSKGIPRKNLMRLAGKSILAWTVEAAIGALGEGNVLVSSDDDEILAEAASAGAQTHKRSAAASCDTASSELALLEVLGDLEGAGRAPGRVMFLQCTTPCVTKEDLLTLVRNFDERGLDSALTVTESHAFLWKEEADGTAVGVNHDLRSRPRRQDRPPEYRENGAAYLFKTEGFKQARHRFFGRCGVSVMPLERSWEIDCPADATIVEAVLRRRSVDSASDLSWCSAVVFDFDGVLTDNAVYVSEEGLETVRCDRGDGFGFELARNKGVRTLILSKEKNKVVAARAGKLRCEVIQGVDDKPAILSRWLQKEGIGWEDIAYVGNDLNDIECMGKARLGVAVADAAPEVLGVADLVLRRAGGRGAAREFLDKLTSGRLQEGVQQ